ncbi:MAG: hypothetical protein ACLFQ7_00640 [Phormidium sp.]|nr:MAG: hypothetical protein HLUCCO16_07980 [Phormidium sp. OSCR]
MLDRDRLSSGSRLIRAMVFTLMLAVLFQFLDSPQPSQETGLWQSVFPKITAFLS